MKSRRCSKVRSLGTSRRVGDVGATNGQAQGGRSRQAILVLGMHRSGTSALTRVFSLLGADLPKNLMAAAPSSNETGHWESLDLFVIHDELLTSAGSRWDDWRAFNPDWRCS